MQEEFSMSKAKTITQQIEELQLENERLRELEKLFEKAVKNEFNCDRKSIHKMIKNACRYGRIFIYYLHRKHPKLYQ